MSGEEEHTAPLLEIEELSGEIPPENTSLGNEIKMGAEFLAVLLQSRKSGG
ncbi:MAG: hypothetical protein WA666_07275 [Nitrospirota bacterium]